MIGKFNYGTGRRKNAVARVFIKPGKGNITVNDKPLDVFFSRETGRMIVRQPLELTNHAETFDIEWKPAQPEMAKIIPGLGFVTSSHRPGAAFLVHADSPISHPVAT